MITVKKPFVILAVLWLIVQAILLYRFGIVTEGEAPKYIQEATYLRVHHGFSEPKYLFYSAYIFLHLVDQVVHGQFVVVYVVQLLFNLLAVYCFFRLAVALLKDQTMAVLTTCLLLLCFPWQKWVTHLYTESLFISLAVIFSFQLFCTDVKKPRQLLLLLGTLLLLLLTRPTGILFIPVVLFIPIRRWVLQKKYGWAIFVTSGAVAAFLFTMSYSMKGKGEFDFMKPFIEEHVICGVPTAHDTQIDLPQNGNTPEGLAYYVAHNPGQFTRLAVRKGLAFFGMTRDYYSKLHNLYLAIFFYPLYLLAIAGAVYLRRTNKTYHYYWLLLTGIFTMSVLFSCDEWSNRFIMPILPFILLAAGAGLKLLVSKFISPHPAK